MRECGRAPRVREQEDGSQEPEVVVNGGEVGNLIATGIATGIGSALGALVVNQLMGADGNNE